MRSYISFGELEELGETRELAQTMIQDVLANTGITATAGIGTNMYLAKIAMDITAKKMPADENGVRIAELDEMSYRKELWTHKPLTDFWMLGSGIAKKLEANYMKNDFNLKAISKILGHAKEIVTADIYVDNQEIIADGVGELKEYMDDVVPKKPVDFDDNERVFDYSDFDVTAAFDSLTL